MYALYSGSLAEPGDPNPYDGGESLVLPKLWTNGYMRMLRVRVETGPAMQTYRASRPAGTEPLERRGDAQVPPRARPETLDLGRIDSHFDAWQQAD